MPVETRQRAVTKTQEEERKKATKIRQVGTSKVTTRASQKNPREVVSKKQHLQTKKQLALNKDNVLRNRPTQVNTQKLARVMKYNKTADEEATKELDTRLVHRRIIPIDRPKVVLKPAVTKVVEKAAKTTVPDLIADVVPKENETLCIQDDRNDQRKKIDQSRAEIAKVNSDYELPTTPKKPLLLVDPDQANTDDPQLCTEYVTEIYNYLLVTERKDIYRLRKDFMSAQVSVKQHHRAVLIDWLMQVKMRFRLLDETMYMCVEILDRTIQAEPKIKKPDLQLVGITSLFIASKYEEIYPPSLKEFVYITADTYTKEQVLVKEIDILKRLDYQFSNPFALTFLRRYSKVMSTTSSIHGMAKYILELSFLDTRCCCVLPSKRAAAALLLASSIHFPHKPPLKLWDENMAYYTKYAVRDLHDTKLKLRGSLKEGHNHSRFITSRKKFTASRVCNFTILNALSRL